MHMNRPESPEQATDRGGTRVSDTGPFKNEPSIEDCMTWRTLDLPSGAPPRRRLMGFLKFLVVAAR